MIILSKIHHQLKFTENDENPVLRAARVLTKLTMSSKRREAEVVVQHKGRRVIGWRTRHFCILPWWNPNCPPLRPLFSYRRSAILIEEKATCRWGPIWLHHRHLNLFRNLYVPYTSTFFQ